MDNELHSNRRNFLKAAGLTSLSFILPGLDLNSSASPLPPHPAPGFGKFSLINFLGDGLLYTPEEYLEVLLGMNADKTINPDYYSTGGITAELEAAFAQLTGKEKAVFLPTGTMANEVAIKLLAGEKAKIVVPENSHIYRDEADSSVVVHNKRLIPAGKGSPYFDAAELDKVITYHKEGEVFTSDVGAVSVECPVRRADGAALPLEVIKGISSYCKEKGYGLHLDGARLHIASAWTGVSIAKYASYFDTVYISQYKYLNAAFGAVLCGPADIIDRMPFQAKIHGGGVFQTWPAAAMAYHHLQTIENELAESKRVSQELISRMNDIPGIAVSAVPQGTNNFYLKTDPLLDPKKLAKILLEHHNILIRVPEDPALLTLKFNASILRRPVVEIEEAWRKAVAEAGKG